MDGVFKSPMVSDEVVKGGWQQIWQNLGPSDGLTSGNVQLVISRSNRKYLTIAANGVEVFAPVEAQGSITLAIIQDGAGNRNVDFVGFQDGKNPDLVTGPGQISWFVIEATPFTLPLIKAFDWT